MVDSESRLYYVRGWDVGRSDVVRTTPRMADLEWNDEQAEEGKRIVPQSPRNVERRRAGTYYSRIARNGWNNRWAQRRGLSIRAEADHAAIKDEEAGDLPRRLHPHQVSFSAVSRPPDSGVPTNRQ